MGGCGHYKEGQTRARVSMCIICDIRATSLRHAVLRSPWFAVRRFIAARARAMLFARSPPCVIAPSFALAYLFKAMVKCVWFCYARELVLSARRGRRGPSEKGRSARERERARAPESGREKRDGKGMSCEKQVGLAL